MDIIWLRTSALSHCDCETQFICKYNWEWSRGELLLFYKSKNDDHYVIIIYLLVFIDGCRAKKGFALIFHMILTTIFVPRGYYSPHFTNEKRERKHFSKVINSSNLTLKSVLTSIPYSFLKYFRSPWKLEFAGGCTCIRHQQTILFHSYDEY